jgi:hypothetical protein
MHHYLECIHFFFISNYNILKFMLESSIIHGHSFLYISVHDILTQVTKLTMFNMAVGPWNYGWQAHNTWIIFTVCILLCITLTHNTWACFTVTHWRFTRMILIINCNVYQLLACWLCDKSDHVVQGVARTLCVSCWTGRKIYSSLSNNLPVHLHSQYFLVCFNLAVVLCIVLTLFAHIVIRYERNGHISM